MRCDFELEDKNPKGHLRCPKCNNNKFSMYSLEFVIIKLLEVEKLIREHISDKEVHPVKNTFFVTRFIRRNKNAKSRSRKNRKRST